MLTRDEANAVIDATPAGAVKLACLAALAARTEPELLRALRIEVARDVDAGAEADLWFSALAGARSSSWLLLMPEVGEALRERRGEWFEQPQLRAARAVIVAAHAHASPLVQLEDELHWLSLGPDTPALDTKLREIVAALRSPEGAAVARWAVRTMPRLSTHVRDLPAAWMVRLIAEQQLGQPLRLDPNGGAVPAEVMPFLRGTIPMTELWVRLVPGGLEVGREPLLGGHRFPAPLTEPMTVEVLGEPVRTVSVAKDAVMFVPVGGGSGATLRTLDGAAHEIHTKGKAPQMSVTFKCQLVTNPGNIGLQQHLWRAGGPSDLLLLAGLLTSRDTDDEFKDLLAHAIQETVFAERRSITPILAVSRDASPNFLRFADSLPKPARFRKGLNAGDFSATIEHEGALIGVIGISQSRATTPGLREACGMEPASWAAAHHVAMVVTAQNLMVLEFDDAGQMSAVHYPVSAEYGTDASSVRCEITIGTEVTIVTRALDIPEGLNEGITKLPLRSPTLPRRMTPPEKWVLIAGSDPDKSQYVLNTAREVGVALATAGYGLLTGGWPGIDEAVTRAYASAILGPPDILQNAIHHYMGEIQADASMPGRRIFFETDDEAVTKGVKAAAAVVLIGGRSGTAWVGSEALLQEKLVIAIGATGGAAKRIATSRQDTWRGLLDRSDQTPRAHAETVTSVIADVLAPGPESPPPRKKTQKEIRRAVMKRPMKKVRPRHRGSKIKK